MKKRAGFGRRGKAGGNGLELRFAQQLGGLGRAEAAKQGLQAGGPGRGWGRSGQAAIGVTVGAAAALALGLGGRGSAARLSRTEAASTGETDFERSRNRHRYEINKMKPAGPCKKRARCAVSTKIKPMPARPRSGLQAGRGANCGAARGVGEASAPAFGGAFSYPFACVVSFC